MSGYGDGNFGEGPYGGAQPEEFDIDAFRKEIESWAEGVSQEAQCAFASQCAARALPNIGGSPRHKDLTGFSFDVIVIRATLASAVAATMPTEDVKSAASSAYSAARSAAIAALSASTTTSAFSASTTSSAISASSAVSSADSATSFAASFAAFSATEALNQSVPKTLFEKPLWLDVTWPDEVAENWTTLRGEWSAAPAMDFWIDWYEGLLAGRAPDWDLWHDIVLINDEHWKAGPEAVAGEIERIQAEHLRDRTPMIEDMVFDENTSTFKTVPTLIDTPDLFKVSLERAEFAFSLALGGNGLSEMCYEAKILNHTFQTCRDDPQNVEMNFMQVAGSLRGKIETGELPESDEIKGLGDTLFQASLDIRATHPTIAEARAKRAERAMAEASPEQKAALANALPVLRAISDEKLAAEFELDFGQMLNTNLGTVPNSAPLLPPADATHRVANRVSKMSLQLSVPSVVKGLDESTAMKALVIGQTLQPIVSWLLKVIGF